MREKQNDKTTKQQSNKNKNKNKNSDSKSGHNCQLYIKTPFRSYPDLVPHAASEATQPVKKTFRPLRKRRNDMIPA
jgi:hypothetical protein